MSNIFTKIKEVHAATEGWCSESKAFRLASIIIAIRPEISVELGVFYGRSLFPVALAHQFIGRGVVYAVDPWTASASVEGQINPADKEWWNRQDIHEKAHDTFKARVYELGLQNVVKIERKTSNQFEPPEGIAYLHIDANHGNQAIADFQKYAPKVKLGGFLVADDLRWTGNAIQTAIGLLPAMGFEELYRKENDQESWAVFERVRIL